MYSKYIEKWKEIDTKYKTGKFNIQKLSDEYGLSKPGIIYHLKKLGIYKKMSPMQARKIVRPNLDYFERIDSEYKAYWLGFLYADGNLHRTSGYKGSIGYTVSIQLQERDCYILEEFAKLFKVKVHTATRKKDGRRYSRVRVCEKQVYDSLAILGIVENKSKVDSDDLVKNVPNDLFFHFLRGFFDGDGHIRCLGEGHSKQFAISFCSSSYKFLEALRRELDSRIDFSNLTRSRKSLLLVRKCKNANAYHLSIVSKSAVEICYRMYNESNIFLLRKYDLFIKAVKTFGGYHEYRDLVL